MIFNAFYYETLLQSEFLKRLKGKKFKTFFTSDIHNI